VGHVSSFKAEFIGYQIQLIDSFGLFLAMIDQPYYLAKLSVYMDSIKKFNGCVDTNRGVILPIIIKYYPIESLVES
jgi:hypothetical protein